MTTTLTGEHMLIALPGAEPKERLARTKEMFPGMEITYVEINQTDNFVDIDMVSEAVPRESWEKATILVTLFALPKSAGLVPNLKLIHLFSAGIDHFAKHPLLTHSTIPITTSTGIAAPPIAEHIIMTLLCLTNRLPRQLTWQTQHHWGPKAPFMSSIGDWVGKTVGIAGYGSIGRHLGRILVAMGSTVHAYTSSPRDTPSSRVDRNYHAPGTGDPEGTFPSRWFWGTDKPSLHEFLGSGLHALVVCLPLTPGTRGMFGAEEFALLQATSPFKPSNFDAAEDGAKPAGAFVVNIARGAILDQAALVDALKRRVVRAAALDVTDPEPLPEDSELWELDNCIVTPHTSALGVEYMGRGFDVVVQNLLRQGRGEHMLNLVPRERGY